MISITCKNLDSLPNFDWPKLIEYKEANKLWPLLLELSEPVDLNQEIDFGDDTILTIVMKYSTLENLELLLKEKSAPIDLNKKINQFNTVLTKIIEDGSIKNLEVILKHALPVDLNAEINEWYTALTAIIENISLENLELLLKEKSVLIDLNKKINQLDTVLTKIIEDGSIKNLEVILKHALPVDLKNDKKLLELLVSEKGQYAMYIPLLLKHSGPLTQEELENHCLAEFMAHEESLLDIDNILIDEFTTIDSSHEIEFTGNIENI